jgi:hypothetical protein
MPVDVRFQSTPVRAELLSQCSQEGEKTKEAYTRRHYDFLENFTVHIPSEDSAASLKSYVSAVTRGNLPGDEQIKG